MSPAAQVGAHSLGRTARVLIVDDSIATRRLISMAMSSEGGIEVVGYAPDGAIALEQVEKLNPDVVTLDIEMPQMDGLETLRRLKKQFPGVRVIMLSSLTQRGGRHTLEALSLGADDYVAKNNDGVSFEASIEALRSELIPKIRQFFDAQPRVSPATVRRLAPPSGEAFRPAHRPIRIVAIGISTGGPNALADVLPRLPADFPRPIVITQHMPPTFTRLLAERLDAASKIRVEEATNGSVVEPGKALIAAGSYHLRLERRQSDIVAVLDDGPPENSCKPAVDVMYRSLVDLYGSGVLAVIMTGMGRDGLAGAEMLKKQGASVVAQDRDSSVVWGMPGHIVEHGLADQVVALNRMSEVILRYVKS
ncbi:MAG: chemotaxis-specific protein-glutamate methyltransferase CheB [Acidobacteria bacterium]|nr:chemotaxis-specific protein-glutamate methyltransferase CheB [Acidobacteriota bacterium]